jgi:hypothetical protein
LADLPNLLSFSFYAHLFLTFILASSPLPTPQALHISLIPFTTAFYNLFALTGLFLTLDPAERKGEKQGDGGHRHSNRVYC